MECDTGKLRTFAILFEHSMTASNSRLNGLHPLILKEMVTEISSALMETFAGFFGFGGMGRRMKGEIHIPFP